MYKVTCYGTQLFVIDEVKKEARLYEVEDCSKELKNWVPVKLISSKSLNEDWMLKSLKMWENTGKVTMVI